MPRQPRVTSGTDIYHVMLRGINRQDIFEDKEDYVRFLTCMQQMLEPYDDLGNRLPPLCTFYAYCLMSNHVHLLMVWDGVGGGVPSSRRCGNLWECNVIALQGIKKADALFASTLCLSCATCGSKL